MTTDYSTYQLLSVTKRDFVAHVVLNSPQRLNAMNKQFFREIGMVFPLLDADDEVNVVVLSANGRIFTAGLDLKEAASGTLGGNADDSKCQAERNLQFLRTLREWQLAFQGPNKCKKPVIVCIHGHCIGGGIDLITSCDIRLCSKEATFSIAETKIGLVADLGTLQRITSVAGKGLAREMAFTGARFSADRAARAGFVNSVYDTKEEMMEAAMALARNIADLSPLVVQGTKMALNYADCHSEEDALMHIALWNSAFIQSDDLVEAVTSFMTKQPPKFRNRL